MTYYTDDHVTLHHGDARATLAILPTGSVDCIVTSPPYFGLRDYGVDGQLGAEPTPAEFVEAITAVFREARRVLADDGTLWLNIGDSYASSTKGSGGGSRKSTLGVSASGEVRMNQRGRDLGVERQQFTPRKIQPGVPAKNLLGMPWRVAFALQDDGWILRSDIIWAKPNGMPESVTDRMSNRHEHVFMFSKRGKYWFDLDAVREPHETERARRLAGTSSGGQSRGGKASAIGVGDRDGGMSYGASAATSHPLGRNPGDVWSIPTRPFAAAHFAVFPPEIPERAILAGCRPGGVVLDPFSGSGTTGMAAAKHGRRYVGIELSEEYLALSLRTRLAQGVLDFGGVA